MSSRNIFSLLTALLGLAASVSAGSPPNILVILVDDMGDRKSVV